VEQHTESSKRHPGRCHIIPSICHNVIQAEALGNENAPRSVTLSSWLPRRLPCKSDYLTDPGERHTLELGADRSCKWRIAGSCSGEAGLLFCALIVLPEKGGSKLEHDVNIQGSPGCNAPLHWPGLLPAGRWPSRVSPGAPQMRRT
jgi:hypothetical protein